ncbi:conserved hypothetical protein [Sulfolobus islandicus Y.G.57.14]|jgi:hypothetical protein|uniref:Uncharacterized protein n=5 Tax=Saccharolobus islandicus TaxID=43080 RepID=C3MLA0_SACI2|nr:hypothetical protein [Sulfolobus islandicus]ACP36502.1 conserved hypothetical protein [Sulfolobus islandicus L.S.2.15]ACP46756.1 conserved hypothetical protein [Sulfolobus islandicus Y.G.57.14]ACP47553.1 conserved hypothetical protein [Sulfolobus islandicus Y.N.15.51]ADX83657.1 conserved hypothetical protein [Sulfolobus islandicus HVE10/4]ADX86317.1 conserved hypothetical protein [Sulfolobus islandicus REY15A]
MSLEDQVLKFLTDISRKEEEIEYLIVNMFKPQLESKGVKLAKIKREFLIDDEGILRIGFSLPIMYYEEGDEIYLFLAKNYADYSTIEQLLIREKILKNKFSKKVRSFLIVFAIPKKYYDLALKLGIEVISEKIIS